MVPVSSGGDIEVIVGSASFDERTRLCFCEAPATGKKEETKKIWSVLCFLSESFGFEFPRDWHFLFFRILIRGAFD